VVVKKFQKSYQLLLYRTNVGLKMRERVCKKILTLSVPFIVNTPNFDHSSDCYLSIFPAHQKNACIAIPRITFQFIILLMGLFTYDVMLYGSLY
jgi:hypothetical protein